MPVTISGTSGVQGNLTGNVVGNVVGNLTGTASSAGVNSVSTLSVSNSAITPDKLSGGQFGLPPVYGIRAWATFNATLNETGIGASVNGGRVYIPPNGSGNIDFITKNTTGDYTVQFKIPMPHNAYVVMGMQGDGTTRSEIPYLLGWSLGGYNRAVNISTTGFRIHSITSGGGVYDALHNQLAVIC